MNEFSEYNENEYLDQFLTILRKNTSNYFTEKLSQTIDAKNSNKDIQDINEFIFFNKYIFEESISIKRIILSNKVELVYPIESHVNEEEKSFLDSSSHHNQNSQRTISNNESQNTPQEPKQDSAIELDEEKSTLKTNENTSPTLMEGSQLHIGTTQAELNLKEEEKNTVINPKEENQDQTQSPEEDILKQDHAITSNIRNLNQDEGELKGVEKTSKNSAENQNVTEPEEQIKVFNKEQTEDFSKYKENNLEIQNIDVTKLSKSLPEVTKKEEIKSNSQPKSQIIKISASPVEKIITVETEEDISLVEDPNKENKLIVLNLIIFF